MNILMIGGTGIISSAVSDLLVQKGHHLTLLNRGASIRQVSAGAEVLKADIRDPASVRAVLGARKFDSVVDWLSFVPEHVAASLDLFEGRTGQYVYISSASVYRKPTVALPVVESNLLHNPFWEYSRNKTACEEFLTDRYRTKGTPITIVRPSHTYDKTLLPMDGGWTVVDRMLRGLPVIVHGDGTSLWTLTHHRDFARGFVGLLGHPYALGEAFHITGDEWLSWNEIFRLVALAAGVEAKIVHVPSDLVALEDPAWADGLLGDKSHSMMFDNSKIRRLVPDFTCPIPFSQGVREVMAWYQEDKKRQVVNADFTAKYERILARMNRAWAN
ncbi:MAG: NAD-dependent epimerase/dehydratase family protein [Spirochaetales bacterium]